MDGGHGGGPKSKAGENHSVEGGGKHIRVRFVFVS